MATTSRRAGLPAFPPRKPARGSALLMVLWISAALAAVAFSLANTVRGETDRTSTQLDEVRGYYLAGGAIDRAAVELLWSVSAQGERKIKQGSAWVDYTFPTGAAHVELIPETAKLNVNTVPAGPPGAPPHRSRRRTRPGHRTHPRHRRPPGWSPGSLSPPSGPSFPGTWSVFARGRGITFGERHHTRAFLRHVRPHTGRPRPRRTPLDPAQRAGGLPVRFRLGEPGGCQHRRPRRPGRARLDAGRHTVAAPPAAYRASQSRTPRPTGVRSSGPPASSSAWRAIPSSPSAPPRGSGCPTGNFPT